MPGSLEQLIWGRWGEQVRRNKKTVMGVGSEIEVVVRGALKLYYRTGPCCSFAGSVLEEGPPPFSVTLVSMMTRIRRRLPDVGVTASGAGGLPLPLLGVGENLMGGEEEEEERAQSHWGEVGSSLGMNRGEEAGKEEVGAEDTESQPAGGAARSAVPGVPAAGSPDSVSLVWVAEQEVRKSL